MTKQLLTVEKNINTMAYVSRKEFSICFRTISNKTEKAVYRTLPDKATYIFWRIATHVMIQKWKET